MPAKRLDDEIDRLYQLPLEEFTAARNALAKQAGGGGGAVRGLAKPPVAAWAVNQLYWKRPDAYEALVDAATRLRAAHAAVLSGKRADLRSAGRAHEDALEAALRTTLGLLQDAGSPATDATRHAIAATLRGLPSADPPGRLTRTLQPGGFEMLAGIPLRQPPADRSREKASRAAPDTSEHGRRTSTKTAADTKAIARAREALASATRALRSSEHTARREEFEAARATREADKRLKALGDAHEALRAAQDTLAEAERENEVAERARDAAQRRAREAEEELVALRARVEAAERELKALT